MSRTIQSPSNVGAAAKAIRARSRRLDGLRRADPRLVDALLLASLVVGATCLYLVYALRVASFQPDEWYYLELSRFIANHFPSGLWQQGIYWRGIQRIDQLVLAAPFAFLRGASAYELAHVIQALLYASTAIPVWFLARVAGLKRWSRALAATLVLAAPWAIVSTSFLEESAAYPAYAWVLYTTWRATRTPARWRETLAIVALVTAAFSRTALLALAPILPLAMIWQQWRWDLRAKPWRVRTRALPGRLWSVYPIVSLITVVALVAFMFNALGLLPGGGLASLTGNYGLPKLSFLEGLFGRYRYYLSRMAIGTGAIALVLGLAWTACSLVKPRDGGRHALAVVIALGVGVVLLSLVQAGSDERYIVYGAIPIALAFAAELDAQVTGRRWSYGYGVSVLLGAAAVIALVASVSWPPLQSEYDFFTYPAATFYARVVLGRLSSMPVIHDPSDLVYAGIAAVSIAWLLAVRVGRLKRIAAILVAALALGTCVTELMYALEKFTRSPAALADGSNAAARSWLENVVSPGVDVAAVGIGLGQNAIYTPIWRTVEFWNTDIQSGVSFQPWTIPTIPFSGVGLTIAVSAPSGRLHIASPTAAELGYVPHMPRYMLLPLQATNPYGFADRVVADDPTLPLQLVRLRGPARLEWSLSGTSEEGFMTSGQPAKATIYADALGAGNSCARFQLIGPPAFSGRWPYVVKTGRHEVLKGSISAQQTRVIEAPLRLDHVAGGRLAGVTIRVDGKVPYPNGSEVSARLAGFSVGGCRIAR